MARNKRGRFTRKGDGPSTEDRADATAARQALEEPGSKPLGQLREELEGQVASSDLVDRVRANSMKIVDLINAKERLLQQINDIDIEIATLAVGRA